MANMTATEIIRAAIKAKGISQAEVSSRMGWVPQQLSQRLVANSTNADTFIEILDKIGYEIGIADKDTGEFLPFPGYGRRVKQMVNHVIYDTGKSSALSNSFYADGENEYNVDGKASELYIDRDGRYFMAEYSKYAEVKDRVVPVSPDTAREFIDRYGTDLHKNR